MMNTALVEKIMHFTHQGNFDCNLIYSSYFPPTRTERTYPDTMTVTEVLRDTLILFGKPPYDWYNTFKRRRDNNYVLGGRDYKQYTVIGDSLKTINIVTPSVGGISSFFSGGKIKTISK